MNRSRSPAVLYTHGADQVIRSEFDPKAKRLDLFLDFARGARLRCPDCGTEGCPVHDTEDEEWRHLNFMPLRRRASFEEPVLEPQSGDT